MSIYLYGKIEGRVSFRDGCQGIGEIKNSALDTFERSIRYLSVEVEKQFDIGVWRSGEKPKLELEHENIRPRWAG